MYACNSQTNQIRWNATPVRARARALAGHSRGWFEQQQIMGTLRQSVCLSAMQVYIRVHSYIHVCIYHPACQEDAAYYIADCTHRCACVHACGHATYSYGVFSQGISVVHSPSTCSLLSCTPEARVATLDSFGCADLIGDSFGCAD